MDWKHFSTNNSPSTSNNYDDMWGKIWKLNAPPKHIHLLWRILMNALPAKDNLFKKGVKCDPLCPRCGDQKETISHVFLDCEWVRQVWLASSLSINLSSTSNPNITKWLHHMMLNSDLESMEKISSIL
jgi:hypothetical protein